MNIQNLFKLFLTVSLVGLFGCGGGGGGGGGTPIPPEVPKTTTTISGSVSFPSIGSLVAKRVGSIVADNLVTVQAYKLNGDPIGSPVTPAYDDTVPGSSTDFTKRIYSYSLPEIPLGADYVIKAKRVENGNTQELKKLIEKYDVVAEMPPQSVDSVSTAAVVVASQKLTAVMGVTDASGGAIKVSLGDPLPTELQNSVSQLSDAIITDVAPKVLEASILSAKTNSDAAAGGLITYVSTLNPAEKQAFVDLVNMLNIVVTAVANNADPAKILSGESVVLSTATDVPQLKLLTVDTTSGEVAQDLTARTTITPQVFQDTVTSAVVTYIPPRVKLEFSTNSTQLYGLVFDVTVPADAKVRADATGKLDMALLTVPNGVSVDAQYNSTTRKIRIAVASSTLDTPLPSKIAELSFDRTQGVQLTDADFAFVNVSTSDKDGNSITTLFDLSLVVSSSGSP